MKRLRYGLVVLAGLVCLGVALYLARGKLLPWAARWLDVGETPRKSDYVLVLGGAPRIRPFVAAAILHAGLAPRALISHVKLPCDDTSDLLPPEYEIYRRVLLKQGVAADKIALLGHEHRTTYDEACSLRAFLDAHPPARILVVTDNYHTRRARWIFRQVLGSQAEAVEFIAAPSESFRADNWWHSEEGVNYIVGENLRFLFYVLRYSRAIRFAAIALLVAVVWLVMRR